VDGGRWQDGISGEVRQGAAGIMFFRLKERPGVPTRWPLSCLLVLVNGEGDGLRGCVIEGVHDNERSCV